MMIHLVIAIFFSAIVGAPDVFAYTYEASEPLPDASGTVTDIGDYLNNLFYFLLGAAAILAVLKIVIAGMKYIGAAGNPSTITDAKDDIYWAIFGLILALSSVLILTTINPNLTNLTLEITGNEDGGGGDDGGGDDGGGGSDRGGGSSTVTYSSLDARTLLASSNISINHSECSSGQTSGCTSLEGIRQNVLYGALNLHDRCPSCVITITGGTEPGHASGEESHANGYKLDFATNSTIDSYISSNFTYIGIRSGAHGGNMYQDPTTGTIFVREHNHWDAYGWEVDGTQ